MIFFSIKSYSHKKGLYPCWGCMGWGIVIGAIGAIGAGSNPCDTGWVKPELYVEACS